MPFVRQATVADAALITQHRHRMFADNHFASEARLLEMDRHFEPWVRAKLVDRSYVGLLLAEDERPEHVLAGGGLYLMDFPPHWLHDEPVRAYLLNFYTAPEARGRGYANHLLQASVTAARERGAEVVTLHASPQGRPIYEKFGFADNYELILRFSAAAGQLTSGERK